MNEENNQIINITDELKPVLKDAFPAIIKLIDYIRENYVMDEIWNGKTGLKFRRSGKTLVTVAIKDGMFNVLIIYGKAEREAFDADRAQFPDFIRSHYDNSKTYHDGKWMFIDISDEKYLDDIIRMINIKKKPNRKE